MANVNWKVTKVDRGPPPTRQGHVVEATLTLSTEVEPFSTVTVQVPAGTLIADVWVALKDAADPVVASYLEQGQYQTNLLNQTGTLVY